MRVWADVYDEDGDKLGGGPVTAIKSASVTQQLDGAGTFSLDLAIDDKVLSQLVNEAEVRVQVKQDDDDQPLEWVRGVIRDNEIADADGGTTITVSGPDTIDTLTESTVGLGRSYENVSLQTIINSLLSLSPLWSASIDTAVASDLQTDRFDGVTVLPALIRVAEEKGIHFRNGLNPYTLEFGAFGDLVTASDGRTVHAITPPDTLSQELLDNDAIMLISKISRSSKSDAIVNWCIPLGAGEGSAALTLRDTSYTIYNIDGTVRRAGISSRYPIYRRVNDNDVVEYFVDASGGTRQRQATISFKDIGSISNSTVGKQLVADMLANATFAYLDRQKESLVTYKISAENVKVNIRPGDMLHVQYTGQVEVLDETRSSKPRLTYISVDEPLWVMKITKRISGDQITHDFEVATVDRYEMDSSRIVVSLMQAMQTKNVSVQTTPMVFPFMAYDTLQEGTSFGFGYNMGKKARLDLRINDYITDITRVELHFITLPLHITSRNLFSSPNYWTVFDVISSNDYPSGISLFINDVDVTTLVEDIDTGDPGPFNAGSNVQTDVRIDISNFILDAPGGIYQNHKIELHCEHRLGDISLGTPDPPQTGYNVSKGYAFIIAYVFGSLRGIFGESP